MAESGFPDFVVSSWFGFLAPKGTPADTVGRLNAAANEALKAQEVRDRLAAMSVEPVGGSAEAFAEFMRKERARWAETVRLSGAKVD